MPKADLWVAIDRYVVECGGDPRSVVGKPEALVAMDEITSAVEAIRGPVIPRNITERVAVVERRRRLYIEGLMDLDPDQNESLVKREIYQLYVDLLDAVEQTGVEDWLVFDDWTSEAPI